MPKRPRPGSLGDGKTANNRRQPRPRRRHLYLIFDDWLCGYSIRKAAFTLDDEAEPGIIVDRAERPPPPVVFQSGAKRGAPASCFAAAFDTMIMAMHAKTPYLLVPKHKQPIPALDVRSRGIVFLPRPKAKPVHPVYIPTGNKLFALSAGSFELLDHQTTPPLAEPGGAKCSWRKLPDPPFASRHVTSYAVHPDGHIFLSVVEGISSFCTFAFPTAAEDTSMGEQQHGTAFGWQRHDDWILPFFGCGHFDRELNAWVGISRYPDIGHVCACDVDSAKDAKPTSGGQGIGMARRKVSKEHLFTAEPDERPVGATLVYMGGGSRFCLVQCIYKYREGERPLQHRRYLSRVTTFSLKYDENGDLTTGGTQQVRYYRVPEGATESVLEYPVAFWM